MRIGHPVSTAPSFQYQLSLFFSCLCSELLWLVSTNRLSSHVLLISYAQPHLESAPSFTCFNSASVEEEVLQLSSSENFPDD